MVKVRFTKWYKKVREKLEVRRCESQEYYNKKSYILWCRINQLFFKVSQRIFRLE